MRVDHTRLPGSSTLTLSSCWRFLSRLNLVTRKAGYSAWPLYSGTARAAWMSVPTSLPSKLGMMTELLVAMASHTSDRTYHAHETTARTTQRAASSACSRRRDVSERGQRVVCEE